MTAPARRAAYEVLHRIEAHGAFSDYALNSAGTNALELRDRGLVTEIVYGVLRHRGLLDHVISERLSRPWGEVDQALRILLRMGLYQLWQLDRVPQHAVVDDAVELSKTVNRRAAAFVNGVLRELARSRPWEAADFPTRYPPWVAVSLPEWLWYRWEKRWGAERALEFAHSLNERPVQSCWQPEGRDLRFQDEASQLIPQLLGNVAGWRIWDACAAPGGKSAILRELTGETGRVVSTDIHFGRVSRMNAEWGPTDVAVVDAAQPPPLRVSFDAVTTDVPCSGLGTIRRNPEIKWRLRPEKVVELQGLQRRILKCAATAVRPGGFLLYSTCSTEPEEDEQVVEAFLAADPRFSLVRPQAPPAVDALLDSRGFVRTFPGRRLWDGFFAALLQKKSQ